MPEKVQVAGGEGASLGGGEDADFAAEVEGDAVRVDEEPADGGVAGEAAGGVGGEPHIGAQDTGDACGVGLLTGQGGEVDEERPIPKLRGDPGRHFECETRLADPRGANPRMAITTRVTARDAALWKDIRTSIWGEETSGRYRRCP